MNSIQLTYHDGNKHGVTRKSIVVLEKGADKDAYNPSQEKRNNMVEECAATSKCWEGTEGVGKDSGGSGSGDLGESDGKGAKKKPGMPKYPVDYIDAFEKLSRSKQASAKFFVCWYDPNLD